MRRVRCKRADTLGPWHARMQLDEALDIALAECAANGLTGIHEAGVTASVLDHYKRRIDAGRFPLRNYAILTCSERNTFCDDAPLLDYGNGRLTARKYGVSRGGAGAEGGLGRRADGRAAGGRTGGRRGRVGGRAGGMAKNAQKGRSAVSLPLHRPQPSTPSLF